MKQAALFMVLSLMTGMLAMARAELTFGPGPEDRGSTLDSIVAIVNDDVITRSELDEAVAAAVFQLKQRNTTPPPQEVLESQVLERLILNQLQLRATESNGVVVDDQTVNAAMESVAQRNNITLSQLREILERDGYSFAKFRTQIRNEILTTRLRQKVVESRIQISEQEVDNWLRVNANRLGDKEYHLAHILIALPEGANPEQIQLAQMKTRQVVTALRQGADFGEVAVAVSDGREALEGGDLGWRKLDQIPALFAEVVVDMEPGEISNPIRSPSGFHVIKLLESKGLGDALVTQTHVRHILIMSNELVSSAEAQARLERLRERIVNGEDFGELARANSNDSASATRGGDLGWVSPGDLAPLFESEMDKLSIGEVSEPFQTQFGWHIAQVLNRRQEEGSATVQRTIARENLFKRKAEEEWELWLRQIRDEAYVEVRL